MTDWTLKIIALLHDPPGKTLQLADHQRRAFELIERAIGAQTFAKRFGKPSSALTGKDFKSTSEGELIKEADRIASAIDRAAFPNQTRLESAEFLCNLQIRHPFCGQPLPLPPVGDSGHEVSTDLFDFVRRQPDPRKKYLALWRILPLLSPHPTARLLPPDTRILDHTLWAHLDVSSALVSALPEVAMLHVGIDPVQTFIYEARRTQDLWMGSYLLSFLAWTGIKVIAEKYGPDALLYPSLRGHPWMDRWLQNELGRLPSPVFTGDITIAVTPNKFVALVPAQEVNDLAGAVAQEIRNTWREIAEAVRQDFPDGPGNGVWMDIWKRQVEREDWPEIYWSAVLWPNIEKYPEQKGADEALRRVEACLGIQCAQRERLDLYKRSLKKGTNVGTMYASLYDLLSKALDARKHSQDFLPAEEDGEKCTVSPSLSALRTAEKQSREQVRRYWQEVAEQLKTQGRAHELAADGRERLSAIAAIKRFAQRSYFEQHGVQIYFPSTSRVAAAPFYRALYGQLPRKTELRQALQEHLASLERLGYPKVSSKAAKWALPGLRRELEQLPTDLQGDAGAILRYDADVLYPERLDPRLLERELGLKDRDAAMQAQQTCQDLRRAVGMAPPTYYAILLMDGDDMGKWLAGKHDKMPAFRKAIHPDVLPKFESLENASEWQQTLDAPRLLAANLHASLSAALSTFAWRCVRWVVEERHFGRVVYAGGDEVLALLPLSEAICAAYELYALFTGYAEVKGGDLRIKADSNGFLVWGGEVLLVPGPNITLSAGLAIVHHLYPLDAALAAAREAERAAKTMPGKAAIAAQVLKRSGETVTVRSRWYSLGDLFNELVGHFAEERLSSRFAYDLSERASVVTALPTDAQEATLKQLIQRHKTSALADDAAQDLAKRLVRWAQALDCQALSEEIEGVKVPQGFAELARWVVFARFVSKGGVE
ncbi:MAG: type III-B CRISPR-associated protein Cas10/Cmr2 [Chloroflexi bacterium]|nr:type III-B CRISPR-associated protein Cas10/Cmr2 [Chloroflexota bacterium]